MLIKENKSNLYKVTSNEDKPFITDDAEEAVVIYSARKNEKGVAFSIYSPILNEWMILGGKRC